MDWMGAGVAVSAFASDCEQHSVFDLAWSTDGESGIPSAVVKSKATESGLGGSAWASSGSVSGDVCGSFPICGGGYRAANWITVGQTLGYGKSGRRYWWHGQPKQMWVYPLHRRARQWLCEPISHSQWRC